MIMAKKVTSRAKKAVGIRGGTSRQHAIAGRKGGLAPHICRGSECTKMRKEAALKKSRAKKSLSSGNGLKKTAAKRSASRSLFADLFEEKPARRKTAAASRAASASKRSTAAKKATAKKATAKRATAKKTAARKSYNLFEGLFTETPRRRTAVVKAGARTTTARRAVAAKKTKRAASRTRR
jgi:hypothetical protein